MNLYHLRVFKTVAEHEHITRASQELILSQPAVTNKQLSRAAKAFCALLETTSKKEFH